MSDLNDQLRSYIDGLARPISMNETMTRRPQRRQLALAAALAGAAVVLIPALVIVGIRWWPGGGNFAEPSTVPPAATSTTTLPETTTTTTAAPTAVVVPNIVGMNEEEARRSLADVGLELEVADTRFRRIAAGTVLAQGPEAEETAGPGSKVLVDISVIPACIDWHPDSPTPGNGEMTITLFFQCADDTDVPDISTPTTRVVQETNGVIEATLGALLAGPTDAERTAGIQSFFSAESADALDSVELDGDHLIVDFNDGIIINNVSTTTGGMYFMAELQANLFQLPEVDSIEFRLNGSCQAFGDWMEIGECPTWTRPDWEQRVAAWNAAREAEAAPPPGQYELVGETFLGRLATAPILLMHRGGTTPDSGFSEIRAWPVSGPADAAPDADWIVHVADSAHEMLWLVRLQQQTDDGSWLYTVRAALQLPWDEVMPQLQADGFVQNGADSCTINGKSDPTLVALTELVVRENDPVTGETKPLRAWRIDVEGASIDEIPTDGIECFFAGW